MATKNNSTRRSKASNSTYVAYAAKKAGGSLEAIQISSNDPQDDAVEIAISHCGICHSDLHLINDDWHMSQYPLIPGHEVIGKVIRAGANVKSIAVGDVVGVGWQRSACLHCEQCLRGHDNLCGSQEATCVGHQGGFAERITIDHRYAFRLPEGLDHAKAAPLFCAGITVFAPLRHFGVKPGDRVGVIGIGGLGHLAIQFARAMGCEVTAYSSSASKKAEAIKLGAHHFVTSADAEKMKKASKPQDFILSTVNVSLDWQAYVDVLAPEGKLCLVGVPPENVSISPFSLLVGRKSICGSPIGSRSDIVDMLNFAALHNIHAATEIMPMAKVNQALKRVQDGKARYRMVLKNN